MTRACAALCIAAMDTAAAGEAGSETVERIEGAMRNRIFHQRTIAGMTFEGVMTGSGPAISCQTNGSVALGVSGLRQFQPTALGTRRHHRPAGGS